jgi:hypothetical protein
LDRSTNRFPRSTADITRQALFVNGFLATKQKMNKSKGIRPFKEEPKRILLEAPEEAYPGD